MSEQRCIACNALLGESNTACAGVCKACLLPERLEARVMEMPEPLRRTFLNVGRDFGVLPKE